MREGSDGLDGFLSASPLDDLQTLSGRARGRRMLVTVVGVATLMLASVIGIGMLIATGTSGVGVGSSPRGTAPNRSGIIAPAPISLDTPVRAPIKPAKPEPIIPPVAIAASEARPVERTNALPVATSKRLANSSRRKPRVTKPLSRPPHQRAIIEPYRNGMPAVHLEGEALRLALIEDAKITQRANAAALPSTIE